MEYVISFLEGIVTFISPCLLPMLPIYVSYFAGGDVRSTGKTLKCASGFVLGFALVFMVMGALAGTVGSWLVRYQTAVNLAGGLIVIVFGLNYLGVLNLRLFRGSAKGVKTADMNFYSALVFGLVFSIGWSPCVGTFLGTALMMAGQRGSALVGMGMLGCYSLGLGLPFLLSAVLIDQLKGAFAFIKNHYTLINKLCGGALVLVGILMATGVLSRLLELVR
jgi:cytochrome c-type biogenesis protein